MIRFLKNIYRRNFCSRSKRLLLELFDTEPDAITGIILEEIGLPAGKTTTYRWWKTSQSGFFSVTLLTSLARAERQQDVMESTNECFDKVLSLVEAADHPRLKNYLGNFRDGVVYSVSWGMPKRLRDLTIRNPEPESRHSDLIQKLKGLRQGSDSGFGIHT